MTIYRTALLLLGSLGLSLVTAMPVRAQSARVAKEAGDIYVKAFYLMQESEKLAGQKKYREAARKVQEAEKILARIVRDYPGWQSDLVSMRRKTLSEKLVQYRELAKVEKEEANNKPRPSDAELMGIGDKPLVSERPSGQGRFETPVKSPDIVPGIIDSHSKLYNENERLKAEVSRLAKAYNGLRKELDQVQKDLIVAQRNEQMYKDRLAQVRQQTERDLDASAKVIEASSKRIAELEVQLHASTMAHEAAANRADELNEQLGQLQLEHEQVLSQRDELLGENERLRELAALNSPEKTKALIDQHVSLTSQLKQSEDRIADLEAQLSAEGDEKEVLRGQLDAAREENSQLRDQLQAVVAENRGYRLRISELTERIKDTEAELDRRAAIPTIDPALKEENEILQSLLEKQKRTLEMHEQSRKLLMETYRSLTQSDPDALAAFNAMEAEMNLDLGVGESHVYTQINQAEDSDEAARIIREALRMEALASAAGAAFERKEFTAAEQQYRILVDSHPDHLAGLINLGTILLVREKCEEAIPFLQRACRLAPEIADAYYMLGVCYYRLNQAPQGIRAFARAVEIDPGNAEAFFYLGNLEFVLEQNERALKHLAVSVQLNPDLGDAHYNMAHLYILTNRIPEAARSYDNAMKHGAEPDLDMEEFLRNHSDVGKKPEEDLALTLNAEEEAALIAKEAREQEEAEAAAEPKADSESPEASVPAAYDGDIPDAPEVR